MYSKEKGENMTNTICTGTGIVGSFIASFFGGWTASLTTLIIFMAIDYFTGIIVAAVFNASQKTETGALESRTGWKGLCKKGMSLVFVLIGHRLDLEMGTSYIRDAVCIAFIVNELISIVENAGLMGFYIPPVIVNTIDILKNKSNKITK